MSGEEKLSENSQESLHFSSDKAELHQIEQEASLHALKNELTTREEKYFGAQFNLPSQKYLKIIDGITNTVTINDVIAPGYGVIQIKNELGEITKARWNGKSYIALGGERKGLRPLIYNGDSFLNVSSTHEVVVRPTIPLELKDSITHCFLFAKGYNVNDLVKGNQGSIYVSYAHTSHSELGVRKAHWDAHQKTYLDEITSEEVFMDDGVQISKPANDTGIGAGSNIPSHVEEFEEIYTTEHEHNNHQKVSPLPTNINGIKSKDSVSVLLPEVTLSKKKVEKRITTPRQWPDYQIDENLSRNEFCESIHEVESKNGKGGYGYSVRNSFTGALGRYQFVPAWHWETIKKVTGIKTRHEFLANPNAQEMYMDHWITKLLASTNRLSKTKNKVRLSKAELLALCHFLGEGGAKHYLTTGTVYHSQRAHNLSVKKYLTKFNSALAEIRNQSQNNIADRN